MSTNHMGQKILTISFTQDSIRGDRCPLNKDTFISEVFSQEHLGKVRQLSWIWGGALIWFPMDLRRVSFHPWSSSVLKEMTSVTTLCSNIQFMPSLNIYYQNKINHGCLCTQWNKSLCCSEALQSSSGTIAQLSSSVTVQLGL